MTVQADGKPCYCGKNGCLETCCSLQALCNGQQYLSDFFALLRKKDSRHIALWDNYLKILAVAIDNIHMIIDCDVLIGGPVAAYISQEDLKQLNQLVLDKCVFPGKKPYIRISQNPHSIEIIGSAIVYIKQFIQNI